MGRVTGYDSVVSMSPDRFLSEIRTYDGIYYRDSIELIHIPNSQKRGEEAFIHARPRTVGAHQDTRMN